MTHILIPAQNASTWTGPTGNNTYLLPGRVTTLIDAGVGKPEHVDAIARELGGQPLSLVLLTHGHTDHASGVPAIVARWPDVRVRQYGVGTEPIADGHVIEVGDGVVTAVHTPGHAPDHVCFWHPESRALFAGDMVIAGTTVMIPASRGGNLRAYLRSLDRLIALEPSVVYPGHGAVIDRPVGLMRAYVAHRLEREAQVRACLERGLRRPEAIVTAIYGPIDEALAPAAAETVRAHIQKLREDDPGLLD